MAKELSDKQQSFIEHYCTDAQYNASKAYRMAGYSHVGADACAHRLIVKDSIKQAIDSRKAELKAESGYDIKQWLTATLDARAQAYSAKNWPAVAQYDRLLGQHVGAMELDNAQRQAKQAQAIKHEQYIIAQSIEQGAELVKALHQAPDAIAE